MNFPLLFKQGPAASARRPYPGGALSAKAPARATYLGLYSWAAGVLLLLQQGTPAAAAQSGAAAQSFEGKHYRGSGELEHLRLLEISRRMFEPDPELQNLPMLYEPKWNGLVEGPTWDAWWIQNSYGTTYSILPFLQEPYTTFLQNSQDLWFDQMGDGKRVGAAAPFDWVAPDGCLCDAARPGWIVYKQGDGRTAIHDWGIEFTAAGVLLQSELLLISREEAEIHKYLPKLERCAQFIESRRDPANNLFLAGPAGNLLAPSYAGWKKPDGSYDKAYLAGLSVTYIAALDRLIELEKLAGRSSRVERYVKDRDTAKAGLRLLTTDEGYFIRSLDPDGVKHGVFGAEQHGYFEASPNHDAIAFRVVDDSQAARIFSKIENIPQLRPYDFILPNYPSYDDMYEKSEGLWAYGTWVNGGHWSTCEARMMLAYYRLGRFEDARRSMRRLLTFAEKFRMDNPLTHCGSEVYQPNQPVNLCYDTLGPAAAFMRGVFEYRYDALGLTLVPHVPRTISQLEQLDPVRFGAKRVFISLSGTGPVTRVRVNGRRWKSFDTTSVFLPYEKTPEVARVEIVLGNKQGAPARSAQPQSSPMPPGTDGVAKASSTATNLIPALEHLRRFARSAEQAGLAKTYEAAHARLAIQSFETVRSRAVLHQEGLLKPLPPVSQVAADKLYVDTAERLYNGLAAVMAADERSGDARKKKVAGIWARSSP